MLVMVYGFKMKWVPTAWVKFRMKQVVNVFKLMTTFHMLPFNIIMRCSACRLRAICPCVTFGLSVVILVQFLRRKGPKK